jgi:type IV pilus assembly protein PilE
LSLLLKKRLANKGFTLVEVMIVVAIIAIILAIAFPSYENSVRKSRRMAAQKEMMDFANFAERIYTQSNSYLGASVWSSDDPDLVGYYTFTVDPLTATAFTITATPIGDFQVNDRCGIMSFTNTQQKEFALAPGADEDVVAEPGCWGRDVSS